MPKITQDFDPGLFDPKCNDKKSAGEAEPARMEAGAYVGPKN